MSGRRRARWAGRAGRAARRASVTQAGRPRGAAFAPARPRARRRAAAARARPGRAGSSTGVHSSRSWSERLDAFLRQKAERGQDGEPPRGQRVGALRAERTERAAAQRRRREQAGDGEQHERELEVGGHRVGEQPVAGIVFVEEGRDRLVARRLRGQQCRQGPGRGACAASRGHRDRGELRKEKVPQTAGICASLPRSSRYHRSSANALPSKRTSCRGEPGLGLARRRSGPKGRTAPTKPKA